MTPKPKIQYVGMFYVHGSEARKLELEEQRRQAKEKLPLARLQKIEHFYVDPVAIAAIVVSVVMLVAMVSGAVAIQDEWENYEKISGYLSSLNARNAELREDYREGYDLEDVRMKALALGMVPRDSVEVRALAVEIPQQEPELSRMEQLKLSLEAMFQP